MSNIFSCIEQKKPGELCASSMAFKQDIIQKLLNICSNKFSNQTLKSCRVSSSPSTLQSMIPLNPDAVVPDLGQHSIIHRFLQRRPLYLSSTAAIPKTPRPNSKLLERLREMDIARNQVSLQTDGQFTATDAKKILRASQMEAMKMKLRDYQKSQVTYDEFVHICVDECSNRDQGVDLAKVLDNSGSVIVLGNIVFLKPEQVVKAINELMIGDDDIATKELNEMERWKSEIDGKAVKMVRRELWGGLGYLVLQTAAFMRLTFWELSWDVMEPICFYVTSLYFMIGYAYFIRTSREPSFEAVFESRFRAKQMKMMKMEGFDVVKYNELKKTCLSHDKPWRMEGV